MHRIIYHESNFNDRQVLAKHANSYLPMSVIWKVTVRRVLEVAYVPGFMIYYVHFSMVINPQSTNNYIMYSGCYFSPRVMISTCRERQVGNTCKQQKQLDIQ